MKVQCSGKVMTVMTMRQKTRPNDVGNINFKLKFELSKAVGTSVEIN